MSKYNLCQYLIRLKGEQSKMLMLDLIIKTPNLPDNPSFIKLIKSIVAKKFSRKKNYHSLTIVMSTTDDRRVPFSAEIELLDNESQIIKAKAASINTLSAFSQALARMERQMDKKRA